MDAFALGLEPVRLELLRGRRWPISSSKLRSVVLSPRDPASAARCCGGEAVRVRAGGFASLRGARGAMSCV
eukprot:13433432-Alexandrium_andersonii.AAC.1